MIIKTLIEDQARLDFLPKHFDQAYLKFEMLVYSFMDRFCESYSGGYWDFYTLDNGGIFISLSSDERFTVINEMNYFEGTMSAEATSIGVNLFALNSLASELHDERIVDYYYALRNYAAEHSESDKIFGFID